MDGTTDTLTHVGIMTQNSSVQMTCVVRVKVVIKLKLSKYAQTPTTVLVTLVVINVTGMSVTQDTVDTMTPRTLLLLPCAARVEVDLLAHVRRLMMVSVILLGTNATGMLQIHLGAVCTILMNSAPTRCAALAEEAQSQVSTDFHFLLNLLTLSMQKLAILPMLQSGAPSLLLFSALITHSGASKRNQSVTKSLEISIQFQN